MARPPAPVRVLTNRLFSMLHDCFQICGGPTIPVRGDTNRGSEEASELRKQTTGNAGFLPTTIPTGPQNNHTPFPPKNQVAAGC